MDASIHSIHDIAAFIRNERKRQKIRQQDLADLAGVSCRFLSDLENAKPSAETDKVLRVLSTLGCHINLSSRE